MRWLANLAYLAAAVVYLPVLAYQMLVQGKNRRGWRERFGHVRPVAASRPRIWVHAVSLGEVNAARRLVERLEQHTSSAQVVVSSTTDTGCARAQHLFGTERVFRYPLDFSWVVSRALGRIDPALIVLVELEVWYNLIRLATQRGVPVAVVNGRLTEKSARRLRRLGPIARGMFADLAWVGAQDETIASRFRELGTPVDRVEVTGSMKWDTADVVSTPGSRVVGADRLARALGIEGDRPLWVCGSTGPGEEAIVLDAYRQIRDAGVDLMLAIVPRKPERFDEVARLIEKRSFRCVRRTGHPDDSHPLEGRNGSEIILGDTLGELRKFYSLARVAFVGRSMVPMGGSDPMEVAALGKPILTGPHMENFAASVEALRAGGATRTCRSSGELARRVLEIVRDPAEALRAGEAACRVVRDHQGATDVTARALLRLVDRRQAASP